MADGDIAGAIHKLAELAHTVRWDALDEPTRDRMRLVLLDSLGVTVAGARTPELGALRETWQPAAGPAVVIGAGRTASVADALWLNGVASCCLELDEGNKYARGHPAAHVVFAALAEAARLDVSGPELLSAVLVGHEVAARFGRAMRPSSGLHTHGHWGALGAAAAVSRVRGLNPDGIAAAIDAAGGLVMATPWQSALRGSFVRNTWVAAANVNGLVAARLAEAGLASVDETPALTLGGLLGELDGAALWKEQHDPFDIALGYFKRHSSCSYTHPPADACLWLRQQTTIPPGQVAAVLVETNQLAAPLDRLDFSTRLAAMFSIPYVVAVALTGGAVRPEHFDHAHREDSELRALAEKVTVRRTSDMDARLPSRRSARVTVTMRDGARHMTEVDNPVGDADNQPFGAVEIRRKLNRLIGVEDTDRLIEVVDALDAATSVAELLGRLP